MARWQVVLIAFALLLALPIWLLGMLLAPLYTRWVERRARRGAYGSRRDFTASPPGEWTFTWMARSEEEAQRALSDAVTAVVQALPVLLGIPAVERFEIVNPNTGFAISEDKLGPVTESFAPELARLLDGEHAEPATLVVNGCHHLCFDVDARSFVAGHLAVFFPEPVPADLIAEVEQAYGSGPPSDAIGS